MPADEINDEKPKVYQHEGDGASLDVFGDDKVDVNRMAEDEAPVAKREMPLASATASTSCPTNGARLSANHSSNQQNSLNRSGKTAFTDVISHSPCFFYPTSFFALPQQYNGFLGNRFPAFVTPSAASLSSPSMGSPSYGATLNGVYPSPPTWFSSFPFDASKPGFYPPPLIVGMPAQMSPSFGMEQFQPYMAALRTQIMESPFHPSPLQSPDTGTTIAPIGSKVSTSSAPLKLAFSNGISASNHGLCLPPAAFNQPSVTTDPLSSMGRIVVPMATASVTHIANSLASSTSVKTNQQSENECVNEKAHKDASKLPLASKATSDASRHHHRHSNGHSCGGSSSSAQKPPKDTNKMPHIKKPLNAFMLYMKEMRPKVMQEAGLKERQSAEINRILGRRWHAISRDEQQQYYEMARKVRQEHLQKYPGWSARDNYAIHKKKKRKRDKSLEGLDNLEAKKCRARFGLDQQTKWCKHCRRKKKCLWFKDGDNDGTDTTAEASPPMQVSSTSQFSSVGDEHSAKRTDGGLQATAFARTSATNGASSTPEVVNSPHAVVTSTTGVAVRSKAKRDAADSSDDDGDDDDLIESCTDFEDDENDAKSDAKRSKISDDIESGGVETLLCKNALTSTATVTT